MASKFLLDTNIIIDVLRGHDLAKDYMGTLLGPKISIVTSMELLRGARNQKEVNLLASYIDEFEVIQITDEISELAYEMMKESFLATRAEVADFLIAAIARKNNLILATKNIKHFEKIKGLKIVEPY